MWLSERILTQNLHLPGLTSTLALDLQGTGRGTRGWADVLARSVRRPSLPGCFAHDTCTKGKEKSLPGAAVPESKRLKRGSWLIRCSGSQFSDPRTGSRGDLRGCRVRARHLPTWKLSLTLTKAIPVEYSRLDLTRGKSSGRKHTKMTEAVTGWLETPPSLLSSFCF